MHRQSHCAPTKRCFLVSASLQYRESHSRRRSTSSEVIDEFVAKTDIQAGLGKKVLQQLKADPEGLQARLFRREINQDEAHALLDIFWALVTPDR
jgi:hypothetical protein